MSILTNKVIKNRVVYISPIIAAVILASSFSDSNLNNLAWVALIPLLLSLCGKSLLKSLLISEIFGILYLHGLFYWILKIPYYSIMHHIMLLLVFSLFYAMFGLIFSLIVNRHGCRIALLAAPFIWVTIEYIRSNLFFLALPYGLVGHTQYLNHTLIQIATICGAYGVSFMVVLVNSALTGLLINYCGDININDEFRNRQVKFWKISKNLVSFTAGILIFLTAVYGYWIKSREISGDPIKIALIQGNIEQEKKWDSNFADVIMQTYTDLTKKASHELPSLIVWPETATPGSIVNKPDLSMRLKKLAVETNSYLILGNSQGMKFMEEKGLKYKYRNSAVLLSPNSARTDRQQYSKMQLFPFMEYLPYRDILPWHIIGVDTANEYIPGRQYTVFEIPSSKFAVTICWENLFPSLCREFVKRGAQFIVNITNEARFGRCKAPYQLMAISVFRAVENKVYVVRCANTGISCIIDPIGRIVDRVKDNSKNDIFVQGVLSGMIIPMKSKTLYTKYGDFFAWICIVATIFFIFLSVSVKKESIIRPH